jgi:hypothetical protein
MAWCPGKDIGDPFPQIIKDMVPKSLKGRSGKESRREAAMASTCLKIPSSCVFSPTTPSSQLVLAGPAHRDHSTV